MLPFLRLSLTLSASVATLIGFAVAVFATVVPVTLGGSLFVGEPLHDALHIGFIALPVIGSILIIFGIRKGVQSNAALLASGTALVLVLMQAVIPTL